MDAVDILDGLNIEVPTPDGYYSLKKFLENNEHLYPLDLRDRNLTLGQWAEKKIRHYRAPAKSIWRSRAHQNEIFVQRRGLEEVVRIARSESETKARTTDPHKGDDWAPLAWVKQQIRHLTDLFDKLNPRVIILEDAIAGTIDADTLTKRLDAVTDPLYQKIAANHEMLVATLTAQAQLIRTLQADVEKLKKRWF